MRIINIIINIWLFILRHNKYRSCMILKYILIKNNTLNTEIIYDFKIYNMIIIG